MAATALSTGGTGGLGGTVTAVLDRIASVVRLLCSADSEPMSGASVPGYGSA